MTSRSRSAWIFDSQLLESASDMQPGGRSLCGFGVWLVLGVFRICDVRFMMRGFCGMGLSRYNCLLKATILYPRHYTTEPLNHVNVTALAVFVGTILSARLAVQGQCTDMVSNATHIPEVRFGRLNVLKCWDCLLLGGRRARRLCGCAAATGSSLMH